MKKYILLIATIALLAGCSVFGTKKDLPPNDVKTSDEIKSSPCACEPIPFDNQKYKWIS